MNYTINEIPDEATDTNGGDYVVMWQNKTKKISILNLLKTLVKKSEVTNTVSATSESVITSKGVSSLLTIPASNTTITNAPPLQNNATYRFFFTSQITGSDDTTAMAISYNGTSYSVKATSNGSLKNFTAYPIATEQTRNLAKGENVEEEKGETKVETKGETKSGTRATVTTYVYCQAYTTLEMMFDGTQFIIMGNPVVISNSDYTVYADGSITYTKDATNYRYPIISRTVKFLSPNGTFNFQLESNSLYLLVESGSYATATFNAFIISTSSAVQNIYSLIQGGNGTLEFVSATEVKFTYTYSGGGDGCIFSLIKLY